jgi:hypothetical protein
MQLILVDKSNPQLIGHRIQTFLLPQHSFAQTSLSGIQVTYLGNYPVIIIVSYQKFRKGGYQGTTSE